MEGARKMDAVNTPSQTTGADEAETTRVAILAAVVRCFATQGWAGTNMSLVARETGMTRGKIQYYFPVLDELKFAAIDYLYECWRSNYFDRMRLDPLGGDRIEIGVDVLWELTKDPLHVALTELEAASRTDDVLRGALARLRAADDAAKAVETNRTFPVLAAVGEHEIKLGRYFTAIFIDALAAHHFPENEAFWQEHLLAMLKECLIGFWARRGVATLAERAAQASPPAAPTPPPADAARREEALALLQRAITLLAES
jgi:AcrR family transcriptional regulator